jgi:hypothetical protein
MHGNQGGGISDPNAMWSCFGAELYGNVVIPGGPYNFEHQRGGQALIFYNSSNGSYNGAIVPDEQHPDSEEPTTNPNPQYPNNSYYWNNRQNLTGSLFPVSEAGHLGDDPTVPLVNRDYFSDGTDNGPAGISCGSSLPGTCSTIGQGYWLTTQSCSNLTGLVGDKTTYPTRGVITGTLYKCTATNVWTAYYTPLTYPHPLRSDDPAPIEGPTAPTGFKIVEP